MSECGRRAWCLWSRMPVMQSRVPLSGGMRGGVFGCSDRVISRGWAGGMSSVIMLDRLRQWWEGVCVRKADSPGSSLGLPR